MGVKILDIDDNGNILVEDGNTIYEIDGKCIEVNEEKRKEIFKNMEIEE